MRANLFEFVDLLDKVMGRILLKHVMNKLNYVEYKFYNSLGYNSWFWSDFIVDEEMRMTSIWFCNAKDELMNISWLVT